MLDMSDAFDDDTTFGATITRPGAATIGADGYATQASSVTYSIMASIQPMGAAVKQSEYMRLPEGIRNEADCVIITEFALRSGDIVDSPVGRFKVLSLDDWRPLGGYTRAILGGMKS